MPIVKYFSAKARVSQFTYLLGTDRDPQQETRSPRVLFGDPAIFDNFEKFNPGNKKSSTNLSLSWPERVDDSVLLAAAKDYVEKGLLAGVPPTAYTYVVIAHNQSVPGKSSDAKRSAVHIKIASFRRPKGHAHP